MTIFLQIIAFCLFDKKYFDPTLYVFNSKFPFPYSAFLYKFLSQPDDYQIYNIPYILRKFDS